MAFNIFKSVLDKVVNAPTNAGGFFGTVGKIVDVTSGAIQKAGQAISKLPGVGLPENRNLGANISNIVTQPKQAQPPWAPTVAFPNEVTPPGTAIITPQTPKTGETITSTGAPYNPNVPGGGQFIGPYSPEFYAGQQFKPTPPPAPTPQPKPVYNPKTTGPSVFNPFTNSFELTTGFGGFSGASAGQFGGGSPVSGIAGGASLLPGSLSRPFRAAGSFLFPSEEEEKKKREKAIVEAENTPQSVSSFFGNMLGQDIKTLYGIGKGVAEVANRIPAVNLVTRAGGKVADITGKAVNAGLNVAQTAGGILGASALQPIKFLTAPKGSAYEQGLTKSIDDLYAFAGQPLLSSSQKQMIDDIGTQKPFYPTPTGELPPSVKELTSQVKQDVPLNVTTQSDFNKTATDRVTKVMDFTNRLSSETTNSTLNNATINELYNRRTELFGEAGANLTPEQIAYYAINDPNGKTLYDQTFLNLKQSLVDPTTNEMYRKEWFDPSHYDKVYDEGDPRVTELNNLKKELEELKTRDPFAGETAQQLSERIYKEEGVVSTRALIKQKQDSINAVLGVFDELADEIRNDPDFSKRLKATRLEFLNDKQQRQVKVLQRDLDSLREDLKFKLEFANEKIKNAVTDYNVFAKERDFIQTQVNNINAQVEKASDNARAVFNTIVSNPDLIKGATQAELDREYDAIQNLGYIPQTMIERLKKNTGKDVKTIVSGQTTSGTKTVYGLDSFGNAVYSFTMPDVSQSGGSNTIPTDVQGVLYNDLQRVGSLAAAISNDPTKDYATKQTMISNLYAGLEIKYGSNSAAISLIRNASPNISTTGNLLGGGTPQGDTAYQTELQTAVQEIINAKNWLGLQTDGARQDKAQQWQGTLLQKYPNYSADIARVFKPYL